MRSTTIRDDERATNKQMTHGRRDALFLVVGARGLVRWPRLPLALEGAVQCGAARTPLQPEQLHPACVAHALALFFVKRTAGHLIHYKGGDLLGGGGGTLLLGQQQIDGLESDVL